jgi:hypothetical protein
VAVVVEAVVVVQVVPTNYKWDNVKEQDIRKREMKRS